jgi:hypothetical protein
MSGFRIDRAMKENTAAEKLQQKLAKLIPLRHFVVTGYARNGLFLLIKAMRWTSTDEIIIPAFTCPVIRFTISEAGLVPVPVDAEHNGINIDPDKIIPSITVKTKAIYVVHTYGMIAQIEKICAIAKRHNLMVIEDLAHAPFSLYRGKPLGTFGDVAIYSFTKKMVNFEGGAIGTNDTALYARMTMLQREYEHKNSHSLIFFIELFVRLVGSWWESSFSIIALLLMKLNDAINTIVYKGAYGMSIDSAAFTANETGCRITLNQIDHLFDKYRGNNTDYMKHTGAASDILIYKPYQESTDTLPFYITGVPTGTNRLHRLISFRTWHNSNKPGSYPRADYLYENYRIFSKAVLMFLHGRKSSTIRLIRNGDADIQKKNMKQPSLINKRGII